MAIKTCELRGGDTHQTSRLTRSEKHHSNLFLSTCSSDKSKDIHPFFKPDQTSLPVHIHLNHKVTTYIIISSYGIPAIFFQCPYFTTTNSNIFHLAYTGTRAQQRYKQFSSHLPVYRQNTPKRTRSSNTAPPLHQQKEHTTLLNTFYSSLLIISISRKPD